MPPKKINPIVQKLLKIIASGKTKEEISAATGLKYFTFVNTFQRPLVSKMVRMALRLAGIVSAKEDLSYEEWVKINYPKKRGKHDTQGAVDLVAPVEEPLERNAGLTTEKG